jgi:hypothetical protein
MLRPTVSRPVSLGVEPHLGPKTTFLFLLVAVLLMWAPSDERTGLSFTTVRISSSCHLYLHVYLSAVYVLSCHRVQFLVDTTYCLQFDKTDDSR